MIFHEKAAWFLAKMKRKIYQCSIIKESENVCDFILARVIIPHAIRIGTLTPSIYVSHYKKLHSHLLLHDRCMGSGPFSSSDLDLSMKLKWLQIATSWLTYSTSYVICFTWFLNNVQHDPHFRLFGSNYNL